MDISNIHRDVIRFFKDHKIPISAEHKRYLKRARRKLVRLYPTKQEQEKLDPYSDLILALFLLDLEVLRPQLQALYSAKPRGTPPRDPIQMFRSLLCLTLSGETISFTTWVKKLRSQPLFAALSGFAHSTPGIGTFYDFTARLYPEPSDPITRHPLSKPKDSSKKSRPRPGLVQQLVDKALANKDKALGAFPSLRLNLLLKPIVLRSQRLSLLSSSEAIDLAGDGTKFKTGARSSGRKLCDCKKLGIYRCDCPRHYTDRFASWGWDSYRECFLNGHAFYELTAASSTHDLPIFVLLAQAKEHDSVSAVKAFDRARKLYPELVFGSFLADSAHDNYPTYHLLRAHGLNPIIALNERHSGHYQLDSNFTTDSTGVPVCPRERRWYPAVSPMTAVGRSGAAHAPLTTTTSPAGVLLLITAVSSTPNQRMIRASSLIRPATPQPGSSLTMNAPASNARTNAKRLISISNKRACVHVVSGQSESS